MGIYNGAVLRSYSKGGLISAFGKMGAVYYDFARGIDDRPVVVDRERKSVGCERTLEEDLTRRSLLSVHLYQLVLELVERLRKGKFEGNVLTLKVKFSDFTQITRSRTVAQPLTSKTRILPVAKSLLADIDVEHMAVRLLGLSVSKSAAGFHRPVAVQLELDFREWRWFVPTPRRIPAMRKQACAGYGIVDVAAHDGVDRSVGDCRNLRSLRADDHNPAVVGLHGKS